jgi:hypothetical protein
MAMVFSNEQNEDGRGAAEGFVYFALRWHGEISKEGGVRIDTGVLSGGSICCPVEIPHSGI